jgi:uncharacterized protein YdgA (DUF945 family)
MRNRWTGLLIAVIAVGAAYTAAAWLIGMNVQAQLENREQAALSNLPYIALTHHEYHRGVFGADEQSTYALRLPALARVSALAPGGASALQLTVRNKIYHGPLPRLRSVGLASIDTELVPPPELARALNDLFGGQPVVSIHTQMSWLGGTRTELVSPAFRVQLPAGGTFSSRGLRASGETTRAQASWVVHLSSGGMGFEGPRGRADFGALSVDAAMQRAFDVMYVGDSRFKLERAEFQGVDAAPIVLNGLSMHGTSTVNGDYMDTAFDLAADSLRTEKFSCSHLVYGVHLLHLQGVSLAAFTQALRQAQASAAVGTGAPAAAAAAIRDAWNRYGVELLTHDPVLQIPQLGFAMPEGEFRLSATLAAPGIKREDLAGPAGLMGVVPHLEAAVDARVDAALLDKLIASSPQGAHHAEQLQKLEQQGLLKRDGSAWRLQLGYHGGKLTVNGQPYPPSPSS